RKWKGPQNNNKQKQQANRPQFPACGKCGRSHPGECLAGQNICFFCRKPCHNLKECPDRQQQRNQGQPQQQRAGPQAQVYAVEQVQAEQNPGTMSGMIILNDIPIFALFDTGATHSFVSKRCIEIIGAKFINTVDPLEVSLASGRKIVTIPTQATVVAQFRDYHAEKFSGQGDPRIVDEWIQGLEFIFEVMECPERYRVICAQLQLTGDARLWWNAYWSMRPGEKAGCTWEMFKELVHEKYYPTYYLAEMERQFLSLQQGTRTVDEYEREFTRLAAF
ncbi:Unknown protein, partial [Striga hermonthica]